MNYITKINWNSIEKTLHPGKTGTANWQTIDFENFSVRIVEYSEKYESDHWCSKGHIIYCIEGESIIEFENGEKVLLKKDMSLVIYNELNPHRLISINGAKVILVDGDILSKSKYNLSK